MTRRSVATIVMILCLAGGCARPSAVVERTVDDATITASVKRNLAADPASNFDRVSVEARSGTVVLSGRVDLWAERQRAEALTLKTPGVRGVVNDLRVEPPRLP